MNPQWLVALALFAALLATSLFLLLAQHRHRQKLLQRAEAAEARLHAMINAMPAVFWVLQGNDESNAHFESFGSHSSSQQGRRPEGEPYGFADAAERLLPADRQRLKQMLQEHGKSLTTLKFEHRSLTNGLATGWAYSQGVPRRENGKLVWYGCTVDITQRKQLEAALEQSRQQLEELAAAVPGALWQFRREADGSHHYSYMSDGIAGITGRTPEQTNQLMKDKSFVSVHPDDVHILQGLMQRLAEKPGIDEARYRLHTVDGDWKWVQVAARAMPIGADGVLVWNGITLDATGIHKTEQALIEAQRRIEDITNSFPGAIWQMQRRPDGIECFTYMSENIRLITGRGPEVTLNTPGLPFLVMHDADREHVRAGLDEAAQKHSVARSDYRLLTASGVYRWVTASSIARTLEDGTVVFNGILLDATEHKQLETDLRNASDRAEAASRAKDGFLAHMSHEIRTPMNAVIGLSHLALNSATDPAQAVRIGKIYKAGKALLKLLNDILEYSRLDAGKFTPVVAVFDLDELQESLRLFCELPAEDKGLQFSIECAAGTPKHWLGDATRIQQVLLNLISNAIKFTDTGSVKLTLQALSKTSSGLGFEVRDTGIGMTPEQAQRVFAPFEQGGGEIERRHGGSGLGLSICQQLVQALGGTIALHTTPGVGTVFSVWLPLQASGEHSRSRPEGALNQQLLRLAGHLAERESAAVRESIQALRQLLLPQGRAHELHGLERQLASYDFEAAEIELSQLRTRWQVPSR